MVLAALSSVCHAPLGQDQCVEMEGAMQAQNEEVMALVMEQYNTMSISMEEEKKSKLEQLYDQIVSFQESIDSAKATLETTAREAETDARVSPNVSKTCWSVASCLVIDWKSVFVGKCLINPSLIWSPNSHLKTFMQGNTISEWSVSYCGVLL